jgi:hypothetical protein
MGSFLHFAPEDDGSAAIASETGNSLTQDRVFASLLGTKQRVEEDEEEAEQHDG